MALIYQSCVETGADPGVKIILRRGPRVIYETFVLLQSERTTDRVLINVAAEIHRHLDKHAPIYSVLRSLSHRVYDMEARNVARKRNFSDLEM